MSTDRVDDEEVLYRRVPIHAAYLKWESSGVVRVTSEAFGDRNCKISVDRAWLLQNDPRKCQEISTDCVVTVLAKDVRGIADVPDGNGNFRLIDVIPDPRDEEKDDVGKIVQKANPAHALIVATPELVQSDKNAFRKLKVKLSRMCVWSIPLSEEGLAIFEKLSPCPHVDI